MSISICPVFGSVALCCMAERINLTASSMSLYSTSFESLILARASEILIKDSSYLGVAVIVFLLTPMDLILLYSLTNVFFMAFEIDGEMCRLAYEIYFARKLRVTVFVLMKLWVGSVASYVVSCPSLFWSSSGVEYKETIWFASLRSIVSDSLSRMR